MTLSGNGGLVIGSMQRLLCYGDYYKDPLAHPQLSMI